MKKNWPYYLVLLLVVAFLYRVSQNASHKKIDWRENYTGSSKSPYGCFITRDYLEDMITSGFEDVDKTAYVNLVDTALRGQNYIFINNDFQPTAQDIIQLCRFAGAGNTVMVSARSFGFLHDTLHFAVGDPMLFDIANDSITTFGGAVKSGSVFVEANLINPALHLAKNAVFEKTTYSTVFTRIDTAYTTVLGMNGNGKVNFIKVAYGKGQFLVHTLPDAFANYYAADKPTQRYLFRVLSYLPDQPTFFDEHYKAGRVDIHDSRRYILSEPALKLGYIVVIIAGLIALFFGGKRRQRPVPVVTPPGNSTLEFVEQVGVLYYRQGNHADIIKKKINYFLEAIRSRFYAQTITFDDKFLERIENLSGVPKDQVRHLFATIDYLRNTPGAGEKDLKKLEELIWQFNERSKR
ncbi:MAG: DUF4350 domain-containing protein [Bacteroidia bacterium]